ncbi:MAG: inositol monophosphatase [Rhodospirillales bacterium]|nr:inositol monophosphatase [Rhodospirillales bacterium]
MAIMIRAAEKAARALIRDFGEVEQLQVSMKGPGDFVSAADRRAEKILMDELRKARPDYGFLCEESGKTAGSNTENRWIIDPLDGTANFLHGLPHWAISIALENKGEIVAALVHDPVKNETFRAEKGTGAWIQRRRLRVSGRRTLDHALIAGGSFSLTRGATPLCLAQLESLLSRSASFRHLGCAALDLAYLAAGRFDGYWEEKLKAWDCAAGVLIVREAGGFVCDPHTGSDPLKTGRIMASNPFLHDSLKDIIKNAVPLKDTGQNSTGKA